MLCCVCGLNPTPRLAPPRPSRDAIPETSSPRRHPRDTIPEGSSQRHNPRDTLPETPSPKQNSRDTIPETPSPTHYPRDVHPQDTIPPIHYPQDAIPETLSPRRYARNPLLNFLPELRNERSRVLVVQKLRRGDGPRGVHVTLRRLCGGLDGIRDGRLQLLPLKFRVWGLGFRI